MFAPEIATGATAEDGWPPRATRHGTTHALLNVLAMRPGVGWPLIALALYSPFVAVRRAALQLLADWPTGLTPVQSAAVAACCDDPSAEIRHLARQLLAPR